VVSRSLAPCGARSVGSTPGPLSAATLPTTDPRRRRRPDQRPGLPSRRLP